MFLIRTYLGNSAIAGVGVFTAEAIKKGQVIWQQQDGFDQVFTEEQYNALPEAGRAYLDHYATWEDGKIWMSGDNDRYANHSETPNLRTINNADQAIALTDIPAGSELTYDYREFDAQWTTGLPEALVAGSKAKAA